MKGIQRVFVFVLLGSLGPAQLCLHAGTELTFSARTSQGSHGEVHVLGEASINVKDLNLVRYKYKIRRKVEVIIAPDVLKLLTFLPTSAGRNATVFGDEIADAQQATLDLIHELRAFIAESDSFPSNELKKRCTELLKKIEHSKAQRQWPVNVNSGLSLEAEKKKLEAANRQIAEIAERLRAVKLSEALEITEAIDCGFRSRREELTLLIFDMFPPSEADNENTGKAIAEERPLVTFVCDPALSFSTGVFLSNLDEKEFDFRPTIGSEKGDLTARDAIGFNNRSEFRVMPGVLVNVLVVQLSDSVGVHLSFGALADFGGEQGTALEFIAGPSLEIRKSVLFTVGPHVGRVSELQGGFEIGTPKIKGLDTVPIQKSYRVDVGFGISYRFAP